MAVVENKENKEPKPRVRGKAKAIRKAVVGFFGFSIECVVGGERVSLSPSDIARKILRGTTVDIPGGVNEFVARAILDARNEIIRNDFPEVGDFVKGDSMRNADTLWFGRLDQWFGKR